VAAQVGDQGDQVGQGAGEPVEADNDQGVAGAQVVQTGLELGSFSSAVRPVLFSANTRKHPTSARARVCRSRIWSAVDTRAYPIRAPVNAKQGAGYGYSGVKGLNALLATVSSPLAAPVIVATRLRKGSTNSARGASRLVADALAVATAAGAGGASTGVTTPGTSQETVAAPVVEHPGC
jgi:hypothetical protein